MSPGRSIPVRYLTLLGAAGAVACGETHPTAPGGAQSPLATMALSAPDSAAFMSAVDDIRTRIEPALGSSPSVAALHDALVRMSVAVATRDPAGIETAMRESENALAALDAQSKAAAQEDLDAVRLVVTQAGSLLASPDGWRGVTP